MLVNNIETSYSYVLLHQSLQADIISQGHKNDIGEYNLHYSNNMDITVVENGKDKIVALGYTLDIRNGDLYDNEILTNLLEAKDIDKELDYINGRYVLIINKENSLTVYTDASALLPVNYAQKERVIASHDILIAELLEDNGKTVQKIREELKGSFDFTRYENILKFNPSLKLDLNSWKFERYYPAKEITSKSIVLIIKELDVYIQEMNKWIQKNNDEIILTLTGGYDSRVSMAFTNSFSEKVEYLTYMHPNLERLNERAQEIYDVDKYVTEKIVTNLNVKHTIVDLANYNLQSTERKSALETLQTAHSYSLIDYFRNERKFKKALHIKSTVYGMGKSDFPLRENHNPITYDEMNEFIHGVSKEAKNLPDYNNIITDYYNRNMHTEGVGKGRHYFEIFHLESRMGNWHSNVTQETDPELLDFIYVNTRRIIDLLQSPSIQERKDKILYKTLINKYWPALLFIGVNKKINNVNYDRIGLNNKYIKGLKIYDLSNIEIMNIKENMFIIRPDSKDLGPHKHFMFKGKNNTHETKKLNIQSLFNKDSGRKYINVKIMKLDNKTFKSIDIVDLSEGYQVTLEPFQQLMIRIDYNYVFDKESWQQAGRIQIMDLNH